MVQNYRRLGLASRLNGPTGGTEKKKILSSSTSDGVGDDVGQDGWGVGNDVDGLAITNGAGGAGGGNATMLIPTEARVERDPDTGRILRVIRSDSGSEDGMNGGVRRKKRMRLDDPLNSESESDTAANALPARTRKPATGIVAALEAQAEEEAARLATRQRPRQQSRREEEWIAGLVQKYGDNVAAMARDKKLNPMQQTEADIARRVKRWTGSRVGAPTLEVSTG